MTEAHPLFIEGYLYRYQQGPLPAQKQVPPGDISRDDIRHWAQGWQAADHDRTAALPPRFLPPPPPPAVSGVVAREIAPADKAWMRVTIRESGDGYEIDIDGKTAAVSEETREKNAAKMLSFLIGEIGKRMARDETMARLAEIHEKTKGAP